jgi:hypothetical protein
MFWPLQTSSGYICFYIHLCFLQFSSNTGQCLHLGVTIWCYVPMSLIQNYAKNIKMLNCCYNSCFSGLCHSGVVNNVTASSCFSGHCKDLITSGSNHTVPNNHSPRHDTSYNKVNPQKQTNTEIKNQCTAIDHSGTHNLNTNTRLYTTRSTLPP